MANGNRNQLCAHAIAQTTAPDACLSRRASRPGKLRAVRAVARPQAKPCGAMSKVRPCRECLAVSQTALTYSTHSVSTPPPRWPNHPRNDRHSDILGVAEGTVKARIARARAKLRSLMRERI